MLYAYIKLQVYDLLTSRTLSKTSPNKLNNKIISISNVIFVLKINSVRSRTHEVTDDNHNRFTSFQFFRVSEREKRLDFLFDE